MNKICIIAILAICTGCGSYCNLRSKEPQFYGGFVNAITLRHYGDSCKDLNLRNWGYAAALAFPLMFLDPPGSLVVDTLTLPLIPFWESNEQQNVREQEQTQRKIAAVKEQKIEKKSPQQLMTLSQDKDEQKRMSVAANPNTPPQTLSQLAKDPSNLVKMLVAENPNTPEKALVEMAKSEGLDVKVRLAERKNKPVLLRLAYDRNKKVKLLISKNTHAPQKALAKLAEEDYVDIRISVARNPATSKETLQKLTKDSEEVIRKYAQEQLNKK
ncbi:YceK/YidQ family lipoprotein [Candidatus Uabimicrobium amorphum]|uniref:DUF4116 domain-containing protein n=1 Tax=Uabimicrobium amorphum TaxID=2596890 RepID=A0A5S9ILR5_UABAM|nr:YceK/YidQ family lipoprotein [Candidatus Uabimicrobium amorphum]BBM83871.1 hypothetical protein UABAM_02226 [Candidatus Uabimicrobium amorphum]